jgi:uncharacterized protein (TIGR02246 family)
MIWTIASCLFAACVATPVLAQDLTDQDARKAADAMAEKYVQTFNSTDPEGFANLFAEDGIYLPVFGGALMDRSAIKEVVAARMKTGQSKLTERVMEAQAVGKAIWTTGEWILTAQDGKVVSGHYAYVMVPDGTGWRLRMAISNLTPSK